MSSKDVKPPASPRERQRENAQDSPRDNAGGTAGREGGGGGEGGSSSQPQRSLSRSEFNSLAAAINIDKKAKPSSPRSGGTSPRGGSGSERSFATADEIESQGMKSDIHEKSLRRSASGASGSGSGGGATPRQKRTESAKTVLLSKVGRCVQAESSYGP
jgi:hypothetical protein